MTLLIIGFFTVILAAIAVFLVDLVFKHQRQLAGVERGASDARVEALERRLAELTEVVHAQTIALDGVTASELRERVGA